MKRIGAYLLALSIVWPLACTHASGQSLDSLWIRMVNDSTLVIRQETAPADTVLPQILEEPDTTQEQLLTARVDSLLILAEDYQTAYRFSDALDCLRLAAQADSSAQTSALVREIEAQCTFALTQTASVPQLSVVAKEKFSSDDFFLYYPLPDRSWHEIDDAPPMYYPGDEDEVYLSRDANLEMVYPMTFSDRLYFSSRTLPGMGGYDLFCCEWDDALGEWGEPRNLGFPYSSPEDDFLFVESEDGKYNIFASVRGLEESPDSVWVYVVARASNPSSITSPSAEQLAQMAQLSPGKAVKAIENASQGRARSTELNARYKELMDLENQLSAQIEELDGDLRLELERQLEETKAQKKRVETQILEAGRVRNLLTEERDHEVAGVEGAYIFTKKSLGAPLKVHYIEN